jgi:hypothetical protein
MATTPKAESEASESPEPEAPAPAVKEYVHDTGQFEREANEKAYADSIKPPKAEKGEG